MKVSVDLEYLKVLAVKSQQAGTQDAFINIALEWAEQAEEEIKRLETELEALKGEED